MSEPEAQFRGSRLLIVTASLVVVVAGLRAIKPIAIPFVIATFLAVISTPWVTWLEQRRFPRALAVVTAVFANIAAVLLIMTLLGGSIGAFTDSIPRYRQSLEKEAREGLAWLESKGFALTEELEWLQQYLKEPEDPVTEDGEPEALPPPESDAGEASPNTIDIRGLVDVVIGGVLSFVGSALRSLAELATMTVLIVFMTFFILLEAAGLPKKLELAFGWQPQDLARMSRARKEIQRYLRIKTLVSLTTGILIGCWVWMLGLDYPQLWGLIAFLLNYIPNIGSVVAGVPAVLLALIEQGVGTALLVILGYVAANVLLGTIAEPQLLGRHLGISTLVVFLSLVFWGWVWGPLGMLLSVPLTMVLKILLEHSQDLRWVAQLIDSGPLPPPRRPVG